MLPGQILPGQMSLWQLESVLPVPRNLPVKFHQNRVSNSWESKMEPSVAINQHPLISMLHISSLMTKSVASMKNVYKIDKKCKFKSNNLTGPVSNRIMLWTQVFSLEKYLALINLQICARSLIFLVVLRNLKKTSWGWSCAKVKFSWGWDWGWGWGLAYIFVYVD